MVGGTPHGGGYAGGAIDRPRSSRRIALLAGAGALVLAACDADLPGGAQSIRSPSTATPTAIATPSAPPTEPVATVAQLSAIAIGVYPACTSLTCPGGGSYTTCEAGHPASGQYSSCPFTARLTAQLLAITAGATSAVDALGGGQDPVWDTEAATSLPSSMGGTAHVVLGFTTSATVEAFELVIVEAGGQLLVDDIYCAGTDPATTDVYAVGWLARSACST